MANDATIKQCCGTWMMCREASILITESDKPPEWMVVNFLTYLYFVIRGLRKVECVSRSNLHARITNFCEGIESFERAFADATTVAFLDDDPSNPLDAQAFLGNLPALKARVNRVLPKHDVLTHDGKTRPGRSHIQIPHTHHPKDVCAAMVATAWIYCRRNRVSARNKNACRAAQALWEAAGGPDTGWGRTRNTGWRRHFVYAKGSAMRAFRRDLIRGLMLAQDFHSPPVVRVAPVIRASRKKKL